MSNRAGAGFFLRHGWLGLTLAGMVGVGCGAKSKYESGQELPTPPENAPQERQEYGFQLAETGKLKLDTGVPECIAKKTEIHEVADFGLDLTAFDAAEFPREQATDVDQFYLLYDLILREVVEPEEGLIDYEKLRTELAPYWQMLVTKLEKAELPSNSQPLLHSAFWINAYNILMMDSIVQNPSVKDVWGIAEGQVFTQQVHKVGNAILSLDNIEYGILRIAPKPAAQLAEDSKIEVARDKDIYYAGHVALVCGAVSCPKIRNFAYRPEDLLNIFEENQYLFLNNSKYSFKIIEGKPKVTELIQWFIGPFQALVQGDFRAWADRYMIEDCRSDKAEWLSFLQNKKSFEYGKETVKYNWNINRQ